MKYCKYRQYFKSFQCAKLQQVDTVCENYEGCWKCATFNEQATFIQKIEPIYVNIVLIICVFLLFDIS